MHPYRVIYNNDGWEPYNRHNPPIELEQILECVDEVKGTQVDTLVWCIAEEVVIYPSRVAEIVPNLPDHVMASLHRLLARGIDPFEHVVRRARQNGVAIFASVRMNDCHHKSDPDGPLAARFWKEHQHYRLWDVTDGHCYYNATLDYAHAEVRQRKMDVIQEIAARYDVDGIELDMGRNPHFFFQHEAQQKKGILTDFLRQVRESLARIARQKGRENISLLVRGPIQTDYLQRNGMDVETWMREKLADVFALSSLKGNDYRISVEPWQTIAKESGVLFRPGIEVGPLHNAPADNHVVHLTPEEFLGFAQNCWAQGVDGIYMFNFPCLLTMAWRQPAALKRLQDVLTVIGDPGKLRKRNKGYLFYDQLPIELELYRPARFHQTVPFAVREPDLKADGGHWEIQFRMTGFPEQDAVHYLLNGRRIPADNISFTYGVKTHPYYAARLYRSGYSLEANQLVTLRPPVDWIHNGDNTLGFYLERGPWGEYTGMKVYELTVKSLYDSAPKAV